MSLVDIKIDIIHMQTTQQNTRSVYNQINRQLIELMKRRDTIPIINIFEQISSPRSFKFLVRGIQNSPCIKIAQNMCRYHSNSSIIQF
ncbi:hypothetical protein HZS_5029 [Henneguya salminicola]|nr:hypothetical protein HZS_5029 [Henneguya salminicola]